jgi:hypothetical protein
MRNALIIAILSLSFCSSMVFADDTSTKTVAQGNQGYIYGAPSSPTAADTTTVKTSQGPGPIGAIINAVNKVDSWIQRNLW